MNKIYYEKGFSRANRKKKRIKINKNAREMHTEISALILTQHNLITFLQFSFMFPLRIRFLLFICSSLELYKYSRRVSR